MTFEEWYKNSNVSREGKIHIAKAAWDAAKEEMVNRIVNHAYLQLDSEENIKVDYSHDI